MNTLPARLRRGGRPGERGRGGRGGARPHPVLRGVGRSGRRHRHDHRARGRRRPARRARHVLRRAGRWWCTSAWCGRARCTRATRWKPDRHRAPRTGSSQSHGDAHPALGAARGARHARATGRVDGRARPSPLRLQPPRRGHAGTARGGRTPGQRRGHLRRAGPPLRDDEGGSRAHGCDPFFGEKYGEIVRVLEAVLRPSCAAART